MGRKRIDNDDKRIGYNIRLPKKFIEEFKKECEERGEIPSRIIEDLIKKYFL